MSGTVEFACRLIERPSITPEDIGCQQLIAARLACAGFACETLHYGPVENLWARRGAQAPLFVFAGHTDVVPPGLRDDWASDPFVPTIREGRLYGRGAADMKGSLAAMVVATERFVAAHPQHRGSIGFLVTSDEEGDAVDGTVKVVEELTLRGERIDWCLVGEPSSNERLGDLVRNGRRGSLNGRLTVNGVQGHVAYPERARNPIHLALPALAELAATRWDEGNAHFPPTSFQISNVQSGTGTENVIPARSEWLFNFRYSTVFTADDLKRRVTAVLDRHGLDYRLDWKLSGAPFLTPAGALVDAVRDAIRAQTGVETTLSTGGGTSDGRFIAPTGAEVVELGPVNASIHKVNESVSVEELDRLSAVYEAVLLRLLG